MLIEAPQDETWGFHVLHVMNQLNNQRCEALDNMTRSQALFGHLNQMGRRPTPGAIAELLGLTR